MSLTRDSEALITEGAGNFGRNCHATDATARASEGAAFGLAVANGEVRERRGSERTT